MIINVGFSYFSDLGYVFPIIGLSAYALGQRARDRVATGCDKFVVKPIEFESLVASIRSIVAKPK